MTNVQGKRVDHITGAPAGSFAYFQQGDREDAGILYACPCGCGSVGALPFRPGYDGHPSWEWDGNREAPTLAPSVLHHQMDDKGKSIGVHWHGFLRAGVWESC